MKICLEEFDAAQAHFGLILFESPAWEQIVHESKRLTILVVTLDGVEPSFPGCHPGVFAVGPQGQCIVGRCSPAGRS